jgi:hypothetical protein
MDFKELQTRLGRNGQVIVAGGLLMLIDSFFSWYGLSGGSASELKALGIQTSVSAWNAGFGAWFPVLLLLAVAVVAVLGALGRLPFAPLMIGFAEFAGGALAAIVVLLRWLTYPTASAPGASVGALWGTYVGVILAIVVAVFGYLDFVAKGGDIKNLAGVFQNGTQGPQGPQGPQEPYNPGGYDQQQ